MPNIELSPVIFSAVIMGNGRPADTGDLLRAAASAAKIAPKLRNEVIGVLDEIEGHLDRRNGTCRYSGFTGPAQKVLDSIHKPITPDNLWAALRRQQDGIAGVILNRLSLSS